MIGVDTLISWPTVSCIYIFEIVSPMDDIVFTISNGGPSKFGLLVALFNTICSMRNDQRRLAYGVKAEPITV